VLWPPLFVVGMMLLRRYTLLVALAGAATSALLMAILYQPDVDPSRIYYGTDTRATGLLLGAALAFVWAPRRGTDLTLMKRFAAARRRRLRHTNRQRQFRTRWGWAGPLLLDVAGLAALGGLVSFCILLDQYQPFLYQGSLALVALTTVVVIMVTVHPHTRLGAGLLGRWPLRWIGLRSYGIYLWHWPVFMVTRPELDVLITGAPLLILRLAATLVLADLSYRFVETPIRGGALGGLGKRCARREGPGAGGSAPGGPEPSELARPPAWCSAWLWRTPNHRHRPPTSPWSRSTRRHRPPHPIPETWVLPPRPKHPKPAPPPR
jgi:peptidoglycan/LPS O-acetylase OafA/YrhL